MPTGTATLDFGSFPGKTDTSVAVSGQLAIVSGSSVEAWLRPIATATHSADEYITEAMRVFAGAIVAGTGFTIYAIEDQPAASPGNEGHRLYGTWTVSWAWI